MGSLSIWHWLIVLLVVLLIFGGRGKISGIMGDIGRGLRSFKNNYNDDNTEEEDGKKKSSKAKNTKVKTSGKNGLKKSK